MLDEENKDNSVIITEPEKPQKEGLLIKGIFLSIAIIFILSLLFIYMIFSIL